MQIVHKDCIDYPSMHLKEIKYVVPKEKKNTNLNTQVRRHKHLHIEML